MKKILFILFVVTIGFTACKKAENMITPTAPESTFSTNIIEGKEPLEGEAIQLTNTSTDNSSYLWDFGDGTTSTEKTPALKYAMHGIYTIKLIVTNSQGLSSSTSHNVSILCTFKNQNHQAALPL